ncbi:MAG TPA: hypothetical protein VFF74_05380 [Methylophilaceae bacterium]|nr:hypothetical protein [Methylophilaceae bacterium]
MSSLARFSKLASEWQLAREAAVLKQLAMDLKMNNYLSGNGNAPTRSEQREIEELRRIEAIKRREMDEFIAERAIN